MKTLKFFVLMLLSIMLQSQFTYSYNILITNPCINPGFPTPYFYPNGLVSFEFRLDSVHSTDSRFARCKIYTVQNSVEVLMYDQDVQAGTMRSIPIDVMGFPNLAYNEPVRMKIVAASTAYPNITYINFGYLILYKGGMSTHYGSISNGTPQLINQGFATFFSSLDCHTLASSNYYIQQYKITFTLSGDFTNSIPVVDSNLCWGYSGFLPCKQLRWGYKISQTDNEAKFITFVYKVTNILGQDLGWWPCNLSQATIVYHNVFKPVIGSNTQYINPLTPQNHIGLFSCNLAQGNGDLHYEFRDSFNIYNHQLIRFADTIPYVILNANVPQNIERVAPYEIRSRVHNEFGYSEWKSLRVRFGDDPPHGCPQIGVSKFGYDFILNPTLTKSRDNPGKEVNDYYLIHNSWFDGNDSVDFSITEPGNDVTYINKLEMFQALVPEGKEFGVTDEGDPFSFTVQADKNKVTLNETEDKTDELREDDDSELEMKAGDKIDVAFPDDGRSEYIVIKMRTIEKADVAATIKTSNNQTLKLYSRNNESTSCFKVKKGFNGFVLTADQKCFFNQIAVVENTNSYDLKKLKIINAFNNSGNIEKQIMDEDKLKVIITKDNGSRFIFQNNIEPGKKSFYFANILGSYTENGSDKKFEAENNSEDKLQFQLYENQPNPFNPATKIKFQIPEAETVKLTVYDISGREIKTLVNEFKSEGNYEISFDGSNLASGVYFYKLEAGRFRDTKRMLLIK